MRIKWALLSALPERAGKDRVCIIYLFLIYYFTNSSAVEIRDTTAVGLFSLSFPTALHFHLGIQLLGGH